MPRTVGHQGGPPASPDIPASPRTLQPITPPPPAAAIAPPRGRSATPPTGGRVHVVRSGESLWSIARDQLAPGASPAKVAKQVNALWGLNKQRIATGDPDLLMAGTKLELPSTPRR